MRVSARALFVSYRNEARKNKVWPSQVIRRWLLGCVEIANQLGTKSVFHFIHQDTYILLFCCCCLFVFIVGRFSVVKLRIFVAEYGSQFFFLSIFSNQRVLLAQQQCQTRIRLIIFMCMIWPLLKKKLSIIDTPGWDAPKNGTFSVSGFSGIKFQNGRSFVCMDLHINQLEYIITRVAMICGIG